MKKNIFRLVFAFVIATSFMISCKKDKPATGDDPDYVAPKPEKVAHGTVTGMPTEKTIGPEGGTISFPDGRMSLTVPQGAVATATNFKITTVTSTTPLSSGSVYRLSPENVTFEKPVEISFKYNNADVRNSSEDFLYLGYQDAEGYWHVLTNTELDKANKTVKVKTNHFSDWTVIREFSLVAEDYELEEGTSTKLKVNWSDIINPDNEIALGDYLLGPHYDVRDKDVVNWKVIGAGDVTKDKSLNATFTAPARVSNQETTVEVTLKNVVDRQNPNRPGDKGVVILQVQLSLLSSEYFRWNIDGTVFDAPILANTVTQDGGISFIFGNASTSIVSIKTNGARLGDFEFGNTSVPGMSELTTSIANKSYISHYTSCIDQIKKYGEGVVTLEEYGDVGGFVKGNFRGVLYNNEGCQLTAKRISGIFRVKRKFN